MTDVPVWLLDVDGVINACTKKPDRNVWPLEDWSTVRVSDNLGRGWPILTARPVLDFLHRVHEEGLAEIRWHTTWQDSTVHLAEALRLPDWPIQDAPEFATAHSRHGWWKWPAAERVVLEEGRDLIWTDDDCAWELRRGQGEELGTITRVLIVSPNDRTGLTKRHLRRIAEYLGIDYEGERLGSTPAP